MSPFSFPCVSWSNHKCNICSCPYYCKQVHVHLKNIFPHWTPMLCKLSGKLQGPHASLQKISSFVMTFQQIFCIFLNVLLVIPSVFCNLCNDPELNQFLQNSPTVKIQHWLVSTSYYYFSFLLLQQHIISLLLFTSFYLPLLQ